MYIYNYQENLSLEDLNNLGADNWEITGIIINATPSSFNAFMRKGFQEKEYIENLDTGANFWIDKSVNLSDAFFIFLTMGFLVFLGIRAIKKFIFKKV